MYNNVYVYHIHLIYLHKDTTMQLTIQLNDDGKLRYVISLLNLNKIQFLHDGNNLTVTKRHNIDYILDIVDNDLCDEEWGQ